MDLLTEAKRLEDEANFLAFEEMMRDGLRQRAEGGQNAVIAAAAAPPLGDGNVRAGGGGGGVNIFTGEVILPAPVSLYCLPHAYKQKAKERAMFLPVLPTMHIHICCSLPPP